MQNYVNIKHPKLKLVLNLKVYPIRIFSYASHGVFLHHNLLRINLNILYSNKNTNHQQTHKESSIINRNTLLHVSTLLGNLPGERFVILILRLHFLDE
jgi:hypothetical protein